MVDGILVDTDNIEDLIKNFENKIIAPNNYFFTNNKLLPWIQVSVYRAKITECAHQWNHAGNDHAYEESFNSRSKDESDASLEDDPAYTVSFETGNRDYGHCRATIHDADWDQRVYDGVEYEYFGTPDVKLKFLNFAQAGNRKQVQIANGTSGEIFWRQAL